MLWLIQYRRLVGLFAFFYGSCTCSPISGSTRISASRPWPMMSSSVPSSPWELSAGFFASPGSHLHPEGDPVPGQELASPPSPGLPCAAAGAIHFYWLVKRDEQEPPCISRSLPSCWVGAWPSGSQHIKKNARLRGRCSRFPGTRLPPVLGCVRDRGRFIRTLATCSPGIYQWCAVRRAVSP